MSNEVKTGSSKWNEVVSLVEEVKPAPDPECIGRVHKRLLELSEEMDPGGEARAAFDAAPGPDEDRWYNFIPDIGHTEYNTPEQAKSDAESVLKEGQDPWPDDVECTEWGRLVPHGRAEAYNREENPAEPLDFTVAYRMRAIRPDPEVDAEPDGDRSEPPPGRRWCCNKEHSERYVSGYPVRPSLSVAWADHEAVLASAEPTPTGGPSDVDAAVDAIAYDVSTVPQYSDECRVANVLAVKSLFRELLSRSEPDPLPEGARLEGSAIRWGAWKYSLASDPNNPSDEWVQARVMSGPNEGTVLDFVPDQIRCLAAVLSRAKDAS